MMMVKIEAINWLSKEALEAEIVVSDGRFSLLCFAHPLRLSIGEKLEDLIHAFSSQRVVKLQKPAFKAQQLFSSSFAYYIEGMLFNKDAGILKLGNILIKLEAESIPGDLVSGDYVSCYCERLDVW